MNVRIEITVVETNTLRAILFNEENNIDDIIEARDPDTLSEILFERGLRGNIQIFAGEMELDVGELSLSEEFEIVQLNHILGG